jgi:hypothetical protein
MNAAFDPLLTVYTQTKIIYRFVNVLIYDLFLMLVLKKSFILRYDLTFVICCVQLENLRSFRFFQILI